MKEIIGLRKKREKHFLNEDGTITLYVYDKDIHYLKDGIYKEIDNTIINKNNTLINKDNNFSVGFAKNNTDDFLMKVSKENQEIKIDLANKNIEKSIDKNSIFYNNILKNINIKYDIISNKVKDTIILNNKDNKIMDLIYKINTELFLNINCNGAIEVSKNNEILFLIDSPTLMDKNNNYYPIHYTLEKEKDEFLLSFNIEEEILSNENLYPLIIDPTIIVNEDTSVYDTYIYSGDSVIDRNNSDILKVGVDENNTIYRTLLKFNLPTIGTSCDIINASVCLLSHSNDVVTEDYYKKPIAVHKITEAWDEATANWDTINDKYDERMEDYFYGYRSLYVPNSETESGYPLAIQLQANSFNITNLVKHWYAGEVNNGIMIKFNKEIYDENCKNYSFYSKNNTLEDNGLQNPKPYLIITYRNLNGLENYMSYQNIALENSMVYINNLTGNVTNIYELAKTISGKFPVNLNLIYNTNDVVLNHDYHFGLGYKINYYQTLKEVDYDNVCLEYLDEDGSLHYFYQYTEMDDEGNPIGNSKIIDEDGLGLTATLENNIYTITDKNNNKMEFTKNGEVYYLTKLINTTGDYIIISYDTENRIKNLTDANNEEINITYNENTIITSSNYVTSTILLSENKLTSIANKFGTMSFLYNTNNVLTKITDINNKKVQFEYYENTPYRLKKVSELGTNDSIGTTLEFTYEFNVTRIKDNKGRVNSYSFNDQGNTIGVTNLDSDKDFTNGYAVLNEYYDNFNPKLKNKLALEAPAMKYTKNYLYDSSFEKNSNATEEYTHSGKKSLKVTGAHTFTNLNIDEATKFTFSGYFKTNDNTFKLSFVYNNPNTDFIVLAETNIFPTEDFTRFSVTANIDTTYDFSCCEIKVSSTNSDAYIYIDDIQLEKGDSANYYNLIENSDFKNNLVSWEYSASDIEGNEITNDGSIIETLENGTKVFKMVCDPEKSNFLSQDIEISGLKGDTYRLSFWYKNEGIKANDITDGNIAILGFSYPNAEEFGSGVWTYILNMHATEWQYYQAIFVAEEDYDGAWISFISQGNANNLSITNISLTKDLENTSYGYDSDGNLISATSQNNGVTSFNYDKNNQLISMFEPKGNSFSFEYDNNSSSLVLQGISKKGIANSIQYDEYNNPIKTRIKNMDSNILNGKSFYIRKKGTQLYMYPEYKSASVSLRYPTCSNESWDIVEDDGNYFIKSSVIPLYLSFGVDEETDPCYLSKVSQNAYEIIKNKNGSYSFKTTEANICITAEGNYFIGKEYDENDPNQQFYLEPFESRKYIETNAEYTENGKFITKTTDALGKVTSYDIDTTTGLINSITDPNNQTTNYTYNDSEQITKVEKDNKEVSYSYNDNHLLDKITCENKEYNFTYDEFLNTKEVKINDQILVENEYEENNGNLVKITYGNNSTINYTYDELDRLKTLTKNNKVYTHIYNNTNDLVNINTLNENYNYFYDFAQRLSRYEFNNNSIEYDYDLNNNVTYKKYINDSVSKEINYTYDEDDSIIKITFDGNELNYIYDGLGRLSSKDINNQLPITYEYHGNGNKTSMILKSMTIGNDTYSYIYDDTYNITHIYLNDELINEYTYDNFNELIEENNYILNKTYKYIYDTSGNILKKQEYEINTENLLHEDTYEYTNNNWKDQLTKYNDTNITYDAIGNPLTIGNTNLTWNIRELQSYQNDSLNISYFYNKDGIRSKKVVNNVETNYFLENSNIVLEERNENMLYYMRTHENELIGFKYNSEIYYYKKNYQQDIIGIYNSDYEIIATYEYDSFGKVISIKDANGTEITDDTHIAKINPYRYRSYYYDEETNLYYLNSRYYNPEWGRFINADGIIGTTNHNTGYNLYAYCENEPIRNIDSEGTSAIAATAVGFGVSAALKAFAGMVVKTATAVACAVVTATAVKSKANTTTKSNSKKNNNNHSVYVLFDPITEKVEYVGRTTNIEAREAQHNANPYKRDLEMEKVETNIDYNRARGLEQALIIKYNTINRGNYRNNQINGISINNPNRYIYIEAANDYFGEETYVGGIEW